MPASPARVAAHRALLRVETEGAHSDEVIHGPLFERLGEPDRRLATELTLGVLRWRGALDGMIREPARRDIEKLDAEVLAALRIGVYQARYLDRIPDRVAVSESVELVKRGPRKSAAGFVNAVLRRLPPRPDRRVELRLSHPAWLVERWVRRRGEEATRRLLEADQTAPPTYLRLNVAFPIEETVARLAAEGVETAPTELAFARRLVSGRPAATTCWDEGRARIQDLSSQMIAPLLEAGAEHRVVDLCAAPGGKTQQIIERRGTAARLVAADLRPRRLRIARELATERFDLVALDARLPAPFSTLFDRVLVDAPCSGTGTLARNPEIRHRLRPDDLIDLQARQRAILVSALTLLAPGGRLIYSTCSLEPEENEDVVAAALAGRPGFVFARALERLPGRDEGDGFCAFRIERTPGPLSPGESAESPATARS